MAGSSSLEMILRLVLSLGVVLGLMVVAARVLQKAGGLTPSAGAAVPLKVIARQGLGRKASVAVLSVGDRALVVGVGEDGVRLLGDLELDTVRTVVDADPAPSRGLPVGRAMKAITARGCAPARRPARPTRRAGAAARPALPQVVDTLREWTVRRPTR